MNRVVQALLVAPGVGLVCGGAIAASIATVLTSWAGPGYFALLVLFGSFVAYPLACAVGLPVFFILRRLSLASPWLFAAIGAAIGAVGWSYGKSPIVSSEFYLRAGIEGVFALTAGVIGALVFWHITVRNKSIGTQPGVVNAP